MADRKQLFSTVKGHILRIIYILFIISFFMPYATVTGCKSKKVTEFTGIDMIQYREGLIYIIPIIIFFIFLIASFIKLKAAPPARLQAFMYSWKTIMASLAGIIIGFYPGLQFLFDDVELRAGFYIGVLCCVAVFSDSTAYMILNIKKIKDGSVFKITGSGDYQRLWYIANWIIIACAVAMVPYYFLINIDFIVIAFILLFSMTIPFILSQIIVLSALVKNEPWSIRWTRAFSVLFFLFIAYMVYLHISFETNT